MQTFDPKNTPVHGGGLNAAATRYSIPLGDWLDLSTGINPNGWSVPQIPTTIFSRLPENDDKLLAAARAYYGVDNILPIAGSQAAIQFLPQLKGQSCVGVINPGYQEHAHCWSKAGHKVKLISIEDIEKNIGQLDVLILINPNNPTGEVFTIEQVLRWHQILSDKIGWLIIDEAFMDSTPSKSFLSLSKKHGFIVLRSLGKFFGLAGLRVGFVAAEKDLINNLSHLLGPWAISHPSRYVAIQALNDINWQNETRKALSQQSRKLTDTLTQCGLTPQGGTDLYQWLTIKNARNWYEQLAQQGLLVRYFEHSDSLRFGLPKNNNEYLRLKQGLKKAKQNLQELNHA